MTKTLPKKNLTPQPYFVLIEESQPSQ